MAVRTVFSDENNNELDCYINDKGKVYISISQPGEDIAYSGFITLDRDDVKQLIKKLSEFEKEMTE
jgi:hypothetical protein